MSCVPAPPTAPKTFTSMALCAVPRAYFAIINCRCRAHRCMHIYRKLARAVAQTNIILFLTQMTQRQPDHDAYDTFIPHPDVPVLGSFRVRELYDDVDVPEDESVSRSEFLCQMKDQCHDLHITLEECSRTDGSVDFSLTAEFDGEVCRLL